MSTAVLATSTYERASTVDRGQRPEQDSGRIGLPPEALAAVAFPVDLSVWAFVDRGALILTVEHDPELEKHPSGYLGHAYLTESATPEIHDLPADLVPPGWLAGNQLVIWPLWGRLVIEEVHAFRDHLPPVELAAFDATWADTLEDQELADDPVVLADVHESRAARARGEGIPAAQAYARWKARHPAGA